MLSSCASTYQYCQVYETKPVHQNGQLKKGNGVISYENPQCIIDYCFWSNGGTADFSFYNKTDEIVYINLSKSFYVMNGKAYDLYRGREWSHSSSVGVTSSMDYGYGESQSEELSVGRVMPSLTTDGVVAARASKSASRFASIAARDAGVMSTSNTVTIKEMEIVAVPPHSKKYITTYNIKTSPMLSCDLQRYPSHSARLDFTAENSPFCFSDIISYSVGEGAQTTIVRNDFYVSSVTNYAEPELVTMEKREEPCENMRDPDYVEPSHELYDKVVKANLCEPASSFYNTYEVTTRKKLYERDKTYFYNPQYQAYVMSNAQGKGIVGLVGILGFVALGSLLIANGL